MGYLKMYYRVQYTPTSVGFTSNTRIHMSDTYNVPSTYQITSTNTEESPTCNQKNSTFLQSETQPTQSALLRNSLIFLIMLTSMTQMYLLGSTLSTQAQCGTCKVGTDVAHKGLYTRAYVKQRRLSGTTLKAPKKVTPPKSLKKRSKKRTRKARTRTRTKTSAAPRAVRLSGI